MITLSTRQNRKFRFTALLATCLPLLSGAVLSFTATPTALAAPVVTVDEEETSFEKAGSSRLTSLALPEGVFRLSGSAPLGELSEQLKNVATEGGFVLGQTEALVWGGQGHNATRGKAVKDSLNQTLKKSGYTIEIAAEEKTKDGLVTFFVAAKPGTKQSVLGFWVAGDTTLLLAWGDITRKGEAGAKAQEEPTAAVEPSQTVAKKEKPAKKWVARLSPAEQKKADAALLDAVWKKNLAQVNTLLARGANPNAQNEYRQTALMGTVSTGNPAIATALLEAGADPDLGDGKGFNPLLMASLIDELQIMELLIEKGADVNWVTNEGGTPLHAAALVGKIEAARILLQHGANPNKRDKLNRTPIEMAEKNRHPDVADVIRKAAGQE